MDKNQREETLHYFTNHAQNWKEKALETDEKQVNIIKQRNDYVYNIILNKLNSEYFLDIGCGTGDLVCAAAKEGVKSIGVDFAQDMIDIAKQKANEGLLNNAEFECCSIFDFDFSHHKYDVISANGFIEYISQGELKILFSKVYESLNKNGSFVLGSRNRLFNAFSLNDYTKKEISELTIVGLLEESIAIAMGEPIDTLSERMPVPLEAEDTQHVITGIDVTTRYQYTPIQLIRLLKNEGFIPVEIYPIHIHGVPPIYAKEHPEVHAFISNTLQNNDYVSQQLIPFASSFMIQVEKR